MAIIYTYPKTTDLKSNDLFIVSKMENVERQTRSISASNLASFIAPLIPVPGVSQIIAGTNVTISPVIGTGVVTINSTGSVSGTGTTNILPIWTDGPNGVLGDSIIKKVPGPAGGTNFLDFQFDLDSGGGAAGGQRFLPGGGIEGYSVTPGTGTPTYNFKSGNNGGFYDDQFSFANKLNVDRKSNFTNPSLDVGASGNAYAAAWFRNGVVISNNPSGVTVDNTSMVIGAGNNDIVSGSDNCLAVGNNNQILADSDHSLAVGQGNTMTNADNSVVVGQQNDLTGNRLYVLGFNNELLCASSFSMGGDNYVRGLQNQFAIGYNHTLGDPAGAATEQKQIAIGTANTLRTIDQAIAIGNNLTANSSGSYPTGALFLGKGNTNTNYSAAPYGVASPCVVISGGVGGNTSDAILVTESTSGTSGNSEVVLPVVFISNNYVDDTAAAAGGIPKGGIYHNAGALRIRIV